MSADIWCVNDFYSAVDKSRLYEQIPLRRSCRRFFSAPSAEQWQGLCEAAERLALPGVRIVPALCGTALFQPFGGLLVTFENVQRYAAILTDGSSAGAVNAGLCGEMFLLEAVRLGMAGCWVTGTYRRREVTVPIARGEKLAAVMALGVPFEHGEAPPRKRKSLASLIGSEPKGTLLDEIASKILAAPSAMNLQPWRLKREEDGTILLSVPVAYNHIDLGIAAAHALLAFAGTPAEFSLSDDGQTVRMKPIA